MKHKLYLLLIITPLLLPSCIFTIIDDSDCISGKGAIVSETYSVSEFTAVELESVFNVEILQGDEPFIEIVGHENMINEVDLWVNSRGELNVDLAGGCYNDFELTVFVTTPVLESVKLESTGDIYIGGFDDLDNLDITNNSTGTIWSDEYLNLSDELDIRSNSTGDVDLIVSASDINVDIDGTGDVILFGECYEQSVRTDGTGHYRAFDLLSEICSVSSNGTGDVEVNVSEELTIRLNSTGDVFYTGTAGVEIRDNGTGEAIYVR
ncbi:MAG TPA: head GIN domain-containing protein [Prolixibacteraceae bacterium]|nr:head GIN domain-containing protein [Prolixibacteraceae bacterium]